MSKIVPLYKFVFGILLASTAFVFFASNYFSSGPETPCGGQNGPNCHGNDDRGQNGPSGYFISGPDVPEGYVRELFPAPGANGPGEMYIFCSDDHVDYDCGQGLNAGNGTDLQHAYDDFRRDHQDFGGGPVGVEHST